MAQALQGAEFSCIGTFAGADPVKVIRARARLIALPKRTLELCINDIERWHKHNGALWTVDRLKFIKTSCIRYLTMGELPSDNSHWFKKNKQGLFYGHWGTIMKLVKQRPKSVALFLQCYTAFATAGPPTEQSIEDYREALEEPFTGDSKQLEVINSSIRDVIPTLAKEYFRFLRRDIAHSEHYLLNARANNLRQVVDLLWVVLDFVSSPFGNDYTKSNPWVSHALGLDDIQIPHMPTIQELEQLFGHSVKVKPFVMALINWIHEPGMKERVVADYSKVLEFLVFNMGKRLYDIIKVVPWDATYHEERGYAQIRNFFKANNNSKKAYCYDLSKATDRFPLSTQIAVLEGLSGVIGENFSQQADLFIKSCTMPAELPNGELTHWEVGQPMGAYPSFALFSLTHGVVLMEHLIQQGKRYNGQFVVHGDDLVILDDELAAYYTHFIKVSGAKINMFKSIESYQHAELNSRIISKDMTIRFPKWKPVTTSNLVDQVQTWGHRCIKYAFKSRKKQLIAKDILAIPGILPNGDSINPDGRPELERFLSTPDEVLEEILYPEPSLKEFTSFRQHVRRVMSFDDFVSDERHELSSDMASVYLQMYLASLDAADTLDKEILRDSSGFIKNFCSVPWSNITFCNNSNLDVTVDTTMQLLTYSVDAFYKEYGHQDQVKFGYLKQKRDYLSGKDKPSKQSMLNGARLNKLIKVYQRATRK